MLPATTRPLPAALGIVQRAMETASGLQAVRSRSTDVIDQLRALNAEVYGKELGHEAPAEARAARWVDETETIAVVRGERVIGAVGLSGPRDGNSIEVRRWAVARDARGSGIPVLIAVAMLRRCHERGATTLEFSAAEPMVPFYERYGAKVTGSPFRKGARTYVPMIVDPYRGLGSYVLHKGARIAWATLLGKRERRAHLRLRVS